MVEIRGHQFYSESEVLAMVPSGTIDSQWETYDLTLTNGYAEGWALNKFHVNKHTGLVTGETGINNMKNATSTIYGSNPNLGIHSGMRIAYPGQFEYATANATATTDQMGKLQMVNTNISTAGVFAIQGEGSSPQTGLDTFLETFAYIGSKYGKITTTDVKSPIYLSEGAFYDTNTADLITGKAWFRYDINAPAGYNTSSYVTFYKNLWSGEIIMQYSLYPNTAGTTPAVTIPDRFKLIKKNDGTFNHSFFNARYVSGLTTNTNTTARQHTHIMMHNGNTLTFNVGSATWITGTQFYQGNPEIRPHNVSQEVVSLWMPEANVKVPSASSNKWPSTNFKPSYVDVSTHWVSGYTNRSTYPSWVTTNNRTGMVYFYLDLNLTGNALPEPLSTVWSAAYSPSYRYNKTAGTTQPLYCSGANYISTLVDVAPNAASYTCNLHQWTGKSLGVVTDHAGGQAWYFGTPGQLKPVNGNLGCFTGFYLSNNSANILK